MKTKLLIVIGFILLSSGRICLAQNYFVNTYGIFADPFKSIVCADNCFFSVASNMSGFNGFLAFKTDPTGNILWSKQISITNAPYLFLNDITQAADGGYLILAYTQISGPIYSYQTVIKLDQNGNFLWTRSYTSTGSNGAYSIIRNNDNGFMFVGGGCNGDNYVFKCDYHGAIVWQKEFTPLSAGESFNIATHDYNHFVVSGYIGYDLIFFEIDVSGNLYWQSLISTPNQGIGTFSLKPTLDNGYVATGQILPDTINQAFIIKIKPSGMLSWMKIYKVGNSESEGNAVTENSDSSILMVGADFAANIRGMMVKTDKNGNLMFAKGEIYQQSYSEYSSIDNYSNGRILLSGQCQNGYLPTFIAVTDNSFSSFCNIADLSVTDSVPIASCTFITHTPVDLSFQTDSLSVSVTPWSLTKNVLCSSNIVPYVITGSATIINLNTATLHGSIMPAGDTLAAFFEYGTSPSYGSTIPALPASVSGNYQNSVSAALTSLSPNTLYHYRCSGTHGSNSYYGNDSVFITACSLTVPVITGNNSLCANSGNYTYLTQPGMTNYLWSVYPGGTIIAGGTPTNNTITVTWNTAGAQSVSVNFTNAYGCTSPSPTVYPVTVKVLPTPALSGPAAVCVNSTGNVYTTQSGMTNYTWSIVGGTITAGGTTSSSTATVTWTNVGTGSISVNYTNANGCTATSSTVYLVTVNALPTPTISGPAGVCLNSTGNVYTTQSGMTNYTWSIVGGTITAGGTTSSNTATVTWTTVGTGSISVNYTNANGCTAASPTVYPVTVNSLPTPTLSGPAPVCANSTGNVYTTQSGMTNYIWSIVGGTITAGGTTSSNTATVTWTTVGTGSISVNYTNANGCTAASPTVYPVTVNSLPTPTLSGPAAVCVNSTGNVYTTQASMTNYIWSIVGGTITDGGTTSSNTATVTWTSVGTGSISVNYTDANGCTASTSTVYPVTANALPTPTISGPATVCVNSTGNFYTTQSGMTNYTWSIVGGTITAGGTTSSNTATVTWITVGTETVSVNYTDANGCTASTSTVYPVTANALPTPTLSGPAAVCVNSTGNVYTTQSGMTNYTWSILGGMITAGGTVSDSTVTVTWNTAGAQSVGVNYTDLNNCTAPLLSNFPVTVNQQASVSAGPDTSACEGTEIMIHQSAALNYTSLLWATTGQGMIINSTSLHPSYLPSVSDTGDVTLTLMAFSAAPCLDDSSGMIIHYGKRPVIYAGPDQQACSGMPVTIAGTFTLHCSAFSWTSSGQGQLINATSLSPTYIPAYGEYGAVTLTLHGSGTESCQWEGVSDQVNILISPPILIKANKSDTIPYNTCDTLTVLISGGSGNYGFTWEPGSLLLNDTVANPITVNLVNDTLFTLLLTDKATGCSATDSIRVHLLVPETSENCIVVHNVVTPNGDGLNDRFIIDCIESYPQNKVEIFNRWGDRVNFYTNYDNTTRVWDGTNESGRLLPDGTYYYVIRIPNAKAIVGWVFVRGGVKD